MGYIDKFERGFLFSLTRVVALFFIGIALLGLLASIILSVSNLIPAETKFSEQEIMDIASPQEAVEADSSYNEHTKNLYGEEDPLANIKLPFIVQKHLSDPDNMKILKNWISGFSLDQKKEFIEELASVIKVAEENDRDVLQAINRYSTLKQLKLSELKMAQSASYYENAMTLGAIAATIITIALFSLVLVLLAIERNTRNAEM